MALEANLDTRTYEAGGDLSANQFFFVLQATDGQVDVNTAQGGACTGVLQNDPDAAGKAAIVAVGGRSKVVANSAVAVGDNVTSGADGKAETAATSDVILGIARSASAADGEIISVELTAPYGGTA